MSIEASERISSRTPTLAMNGGAATAEAVNAAPTAASLDKDATPPEPGVALYDLKSNQCLYAVAEPTPRFHLFCAAATKLGEAFCPAHQTLCYATIPARNTPAEPQGHHRRKSALAIKAALE